MAFISPGFETLAQQKSRELSDRAIIDESLFRHHILYQGYIVHAPSHRDSGQLTTTGLDRPVTSWLLRQPILYHTCVCVCFFRDRRLAVWKAQASILHGTTAKTVLSLLVLEVLHMEHGAFLKLERYLSALFGAYPFKSPLGLLTGWHQLVISGPWIEKGSHSELQVHASNALWLRNLIDRVKLNCDLIERWVKCWITRNSVFACRKRGFCINTNTRCNGCGSLVGGDVIPSDLKRPGFVSG